MSDSSSSRTSSSSEDSYLPINLQGNSERALQQRRQRMIENYRKSKTWEVGQYCVFRRTWRKVGPSGELDGPDMVTCVIWEGSKIIAVNENGTYNLIFGWDFCHHEKNVKGEDMLASKEDIPADNDVKMDEYIDVKDWNKYDLENHRKYKFDVKQRRMEKKEKRKVDLKNMYDLNHLKLSTKIKDSMTNKEVTLYLPKSRQPRQYHGMGFSHLTKLEEKIEKFKEVHEEDRMQATYIRSIVGSNAGPYDRPIHIPVNLGLESNTFQESTEFNHEPKDKHYRFSVDRNIYEKNTTQNAIEALVIEEEIADDFNIVGPFTKADHSMYYTCKEGKCIIPCICQMCVNDATDICQVHEVNYVASGFDPEIDAFTVRSSDTIDISKVKLDKYDSNKLCLRDSCRQGIKFTEGRLKDEPVPIVERTLYKEDILKCTGNECECPCCPFCKTVQVIKFTGIPKDCKDCMTDLEDHEAYHFVVQEDCKFCKYICKEANDFENKDIFDFWCENRMIRYQDRLTCHICDIEFNDIDTRIKHVRDTHRIDPFKCSLCDFETKYNRDMKRHVRLIHEENPTMFTCDVCNYESSSKYNLERHINTCHKDKDNLECEICDFVTTKKTDLNKHIRTIHTKKRKLVCDQCDFEAEQTKYLTQHKKRKHT